MSVRLFLDAHISSRRVARALRAQGNDVRAADEDRALDGLDDGGLLELAAADDRILVTANVRDFLPILRDWAEAGRSHAGCILIASSIHQHPFGAIIAAVAAAIADRPEHVAWRDHVHWLSRQG